MDDNTVEEKEFSIRWYHFLAAGIAAVLAIIAITKVLSRYDFSLVGNTFNLRASVGCEGDPSLDKFKYFGVHENDFFVIEKGNIKKVENEDDADLQVLSLTGVPKFRIKINDEWKESKFMYGEENTYTLQEVEECKLQTKFQFNG